MLLLIGAFLIGLAWLLPGHYFPWAAFQQELVAAVGAAFIAGAAWRNASAAKGVAFTPLAWMALAVAVVPLLQWAAGQVLFMSDAVLSAAYVAAFGLCVASGATLAQVQRADFLDALTASVVSAGIVSTAFALCQWLGVSLGIYLVDLPPGGFPYANFAQRNHQATLLALGVAGLLRLYESRRIHSTAMIVGLLYLGFGIVMTMSRTGWLFVALLAAGYLLLRKRASLRASPGAVLIAVSAFAGAVAAWAPLNEALFISSGSSLVDQFRPSSNLRPIHWQTLCDALLRAPWFGYGWAQVPLAQKLTVLSHPYTGEALSNSHNVALDLLIWNGIPIGAVIVLALVAWFVRQISICRDAQRFTVLAGVGAIWLHGLLEYPLSYAYFLLPLGLLMGALDGLKPESPRFWLSRWQFAVPALAMVSLCGYIAFEYLQVDSTSRVLRFVAAGIGVDKVAVAPEPDVLLLDRPRQFHRYMLSRPRTGMSEGEIEWVLRISDMHPFASSLFRQAVVLGLNGRASEAQTTLARLCWTQNPARCAEARQGWAATRQQYPALQSIEFPAVAVPSP
jgi:O-antigen ligase